MKVKIRRVASDNLDQYILFLNKYNFNYINQTIEINTLDDLVSLSKDIGQELIVTTYEYEDGFEIEIYDDYRE